MFGSMLMWHIRDGRFGSNQLERLAAFNGMLTEWYDARPGSNRLPWICLLNITSDGWGDLSGPAIKAAMTKEATPFFADYAERFWAGGTEYEERMRAVVQCLKQFYDILGGQDLIMTPASLRKLRHTCTTFGQEFMRCREHARVQGLLSWQITTKVHKMQHIPAQARMLNPKHIACYIDESAIGTTTTVWKRSLKGKYKASASRNVFTKRVVVVLLRLEGI